MRPWVGAQLAWSPRWHYLPDFVSPRFGMTSGHYVGSRVDLIVRALLSSDFHFGWMICRHRGWLGRKPGRMRGRQSASERVLRSRGVAWYYARLDNKREQGKHPSRCSQCALTTGSSTGKSRSRRPTRSTWIPRSFPPRTSPGAGGEGILPQVPSGRRSTIFMIDQTARVLQLLGSTTGEIMLDSKIMPSDPSRISLS